ncbi:choice-of-anchor Q domain-containing protein, partial [Pseudopedobacter beijingensis]
EATTNGGGMYNWDQSSPVLTDVVVSNNTANTNGGGMYNSGSSPVLTNVTLNGNTASYGGGMYNSGSSPVLTNVTLSGNTAVVGGGMSNFVPEFYHSLVQGGGSSTSWNSSFGNDGGDNIDSNPLFTDVANGDYSLANGSPAIDKGDNDRVAVNKDLAGNSRIRNNQVDMGAYEYQSGNTVLLIRPSSDNILYVKEGAAGDGSSWDKSADLADALKWANEKVD